MRGKVEDDASDDGRCGITPAYAGKSPKTNFKKSFGGDHPRVCGEKKTASQKR